jgi:hypothetical protein
LSRILHFTKFTFLFSAPRRYALLRQNPLHIFSFSITHVYTKISGDFFEKREKGIAQKFPQKEKGISQFSQICSMGAAATANAVKCVAIANQSIEEARQQQFCNPNIIICDKSRNSYLE